MTRARVILIGGAGMVAGLVSLSMMIGERNRDRLLISSAKRAGLSFSHEDPFDCAGPPFDLFREGDGRGTQNVMWQPEAEHPIRVFDYWWYDEYEDNERRGPSLVPPPHLRDRRGRMAVAAALAHQGRAHQQSGVGARRCATSSSSPRSSTARSS